VRYGAVHRPRAAHGGSSRLLDVSSAEGADLPVRLQRALARGADVADLRVAHRADDEVLLDGGAAVGTAAILGELALAQRHVELLLLAIRHVGRRAHHDIGHKADERDEGEQAPGPKRLDAATLRVDEDIHDGEQVESDHEGDEAVHGKHQLRGHELLDVLGHEPHLSAGCEIAKLFIIAPYCIPPAPSSETTGNRAR